MKKLSVLFVSLMALMFVVSAGIAADSVTEFSPHTLGELVSWDDTEEDVWNLVNQYKDAGLACEDDEDEDDPNDAHAYWNIPPEGEKKEKSKKGKRLLIVKR